MGREYTHHAVNHSKQFVDEDGNHTNNMEDQQDEGANSVNPSIKVVMQIPVAN
jgi:hypothetical protein